MPITIQFVKEGRVVLTTLSDPLDMKDVQAAAARAEVEMASNNCKFVHSVVDCLGVHSLPTNIMSASVNLAKHTGPVSGELVFAVQNTYVLLIAKMMSKTIASHRINIYSTMEEAWAHIDKILEKESAISQA